MINTLIAHGVVASVAYLIGSIPFGVLIARAKGVDLRKAGSGNVGATNVGRLLGFRWFLLVFALDFGKGFVPAMAGQVFAATNCGESWSVPSIEFDLALTAGIAACLGHVFSVFLRFKGGKAVATGLGMLTALAPLTAGIALGVFLLVFALSRFVSLASITAATLAPILYIGLRLSGVMGGEQPSACMAGAEWLRFGVITALCALIVIKHRSNIGRLLRGEELRFSRKAKQE